MRVYELDVEIEQIVPADRPYQLTVVLPKLEVRRRLTGGPRWKVLLEDLQIHHAPWDGQQLTEPGTRKEQGEGEEPGETGTTATKQTKNCPAQPGEATEPLPEETTE